MMHFCRNAIEHHGKRNITERDTSEDVLKNIVVSNGLDVDSIKAKFIQKNKVCLITDDFKFAYSD